MTDALAAMGRYDWPTLFHAYGPASDAPECLRALVSGAQGQREFALEHLEALEHAITQGDVSIEVGEEALRRIRVK